MKRQTAKVTPLFQAGDGDGFSFARGQVGFGLAAEAAIEWVRRRKISFSTRSEDGTKAWDTFATLDATAKKLGVSFFEYIYTTNPHNIVVIS